METLLAISVLVMLLAAAAAIYQRTGTLADRRNFPPLGRIVDIGGQSLHLVESGEGCPAVIFESGIAATCLNWTATLREVGRFTRACAYDRAGLGWSGPAATPRVPSNLVDELHALLAAARIPPPYVLAAHSFGGLLARAYTAKFPDEIAGLVLIDPLAATDWLHPGDDQSRMLRRGVRLSRRGAWLARLGIVRFSLAVLTGGGRRIPKLVARLTSGRGESVLTRLVGEVQKMPPAVWPMVQAHWCQPKCFLGMAQYLEALPASASEAAALPDLSGIPLSILSAGDSTLEQLAEREALARRSSRGKHFQIPGSGHWIHLDQPGAVVQAIREMVESLRPA